MPACCNHNSDQGRRCPNRRPRQLRDPSEVFMQAARAIRRWAARVGVSFLMHAGFLSPSMLLLWLEWLRDDMPPQHPGLPIVLQEIAETKERCRA